MAIAFDNKVSGGTASGTLTISGFTVAATNPGLWLGVMASDGDVITGVTFNGVAMNQIKKQLAGSGSAFKYGYWLAGQSGTHDVVATVSSGPIYADAVSVTGVDQSNVADASGSASGNGIGTLDIPITVVAPNCWIFAAGENDSSASIAWTAVVSARQGNSSYAGIGIADSNGTVPTGAQNVTLGSGGGSAILYGVVASFAPATGGDVGGDLPFITTVDFQRVA